MSVSIPIIRVAAGLGLLLTVCLVYWHKLHTRSTLPLPPGPKGESILGHLRIIPESHPEYTYTQWGKDYSQC